MLWFNLQMSTQTHTVAHSLFPGGMKENIGRVKVIKFVGWDRNTSVGKGKATHENKPNQGIRFPSWGEAGIQPSQGKQDSIRPNGDLGWQMPSLWMSSSSFSFPQLYMLRMIPYGVGYPFSPLGSAVPAVCSPDFLCSPSLLSSGVGWGTEKTLTV